MDGAKQILVMKMGEFTLPKSIVKELRERANKTGTTIEEYILDMITKGMDPGEGSGKYMAGAKELIEQARREMEKGNLRQASEKIWGACALAIKAYALAKDGIRIESHKDLWTYKDHVARELGEWVRIVFKLADSMHRNFYEDLATEEDVNDVLKEVEKLVREISKALQYNNPLKI